MRRDPEYWQRLRKDPRSNAAAALGAIAALFGALGIIMAFSEGTHYETRASPIFWLAMIPLVWWVSGLTSFSWRSVRLWTPALTIACMAGGTGVVMSIIQERDLWIPSINFALVLLSTGASFAFRRHSLVDREGPADK